MPYIGNTIRAADDYRLIDDISSGFNGSTTSFALQVAGSAPVPFPKSPQQVLISVNGVIQEPDPTGASGFNLVGTNIVFSSAPTNGHAFFGIIYATADYLNAGGNFPAGSLGAPSITFIGDENTGLFRKSGGSVGFVSDATEIANFDSNGITISSGNLIIPDSIIHAGDSNTKIRFSGADTFSVETAGNEAFKVDSSGHILPGADSQFNIGANATRFANGYFDTLYGNGANLTGINTDLVSDTSPQLGGNLDINGNDIVSVSNADIDIIPNGTGKTSFGGTQGVKLPVGDTSERVNTQGVIRFNTSIGLAEYYNGNSWISIDSPPQVSSVSPTDIESAAGGNASIVVTGSNFSTGATVKFISNTGTVLTASSVSRDSANQLTATIARSSFSNSEEPYDVRVTNTSNLQNTLPDAINVDNSPVFSTPAGQIGGGFTGDAYSYTVAATDPDGTSVTFSLVSGSLPTGGSLNSTTGVISGTHPSVGSNTTFSFTIGATSNGKTTNRAFSIQSKVEGSPTFYTSSGSFALNAPEAVIVTVIGGGGGGGSTPDGSSGGSGGGGGGMARKEYANLAAGTYTLTVGAGGARTPADGSSSAGGAGGTSSFSGTGITTVQATGGQGGAVSGQGTTGAGGQGGVGSNGDTNGTGGTGANGRGDADSNGNDGNAGSNGGAGGGGGGTDAGQSGSVRSGNGGNGSATYYTGGGGSGGCDRNGQTINGSQIGTVGTGFTSGGKGGGVGEAATNGGGNAGGQAGSARGGPTPRNNFGGGGGSYGGGGGGAGSGDDIANPQSGGGGGGVIAIVT